MRLSSLSLVLCASLVGACSSGYSSGVDGSKPVSELSSDESELACENLSDYLLGTYPESTQDSYNCYFRALSDLTRTPAECQVEYNDCMRSPPNFPFDIQPLNCSLPFIDLTCDATVAQAEACVSADAEALNERIAEVTCAAAGNVPELMRLAEMVPVPDECTRLSATCPTLADGAFR